MIKWVLTFISIIAWLLGLIPGVNILSNIIYWLIWLGTFLHFYIKVLGQPKVIIISFIAFILGLIPIVDWIPWDIAATWMTTKIAEKHDQEHQAAKPATQGPKVINPVRTRR
jgi:hypothetical protein